MSLLVNIQSPLMSTLTWIYYYQLSAKNMNIIIFQLNCDFMRIYLYRQASTWNILSISHTICSSYHFLFFSCYLVKQSCVHSDVSLLFIILCDNMKEREMYSFSIVHYKWKICLRVKYRIEYKIYIVHTRYNIAQ